MTALPAHPSLHVFGGFAFRQTGIAENGNEVGTDLGRQVGRQLLGGYSRRPAGVKTLHTASEMELMINRKCNKLLKYWLAAKR